MKKIFFLFSVLPLFSGCSKETAPMPEPSPVGGIISVRPQAALSNEPQGAAEIQNKTTTRAADDVALTYTFEAWTREAEPRCVLHKTAGGTLTEAAIEIALIPGDYDFLFWADYGPDHYNTSDLRKVSFTGNYTPGNTRDAFAGRLENVRWNGGNSFGATLTRPLAKLTMRNAAPFSSEKTVEVQYRGVPTRYDVLTGETSGQQTMAVAFPNASSGSALVGEDFLFVPSDGQNVAIAMTVSGVIKTLDALKLKPNYKTNITATFE